MIGYKKLTASDPEEQRLRVAWYETRASGTALEHEVADLRLAAYLWNRVERAIAEDRRKHPKAKRNQPFEGAAGQGRALP